MHVYTYIHTQYTHTQTQRNDRIWADHAAAWRPSLGLLLLLLLLLLSGQGVQRGGAVAAAHRATAEGPDATA